MICKLPRMMDFSSGSSVPTMPATQPARTSRVTFPFISQPYVPSIEETRYGTIFVVINQRSIAADIDIGHVPAIAAAAVALHAAGVQMVAALHLNIARDFQIGISLNRALIGAADHIVQTTRRGRVDITACRNHNIGAVYCCFVTAAVERFA